MLGILVSSHGEDATLPKVSSAVLRQSLWAVLGSLWCAAGVLGWGRILVL